MNYNTMKKAELIAYILRIESKPALTITACQVFPFHDNPKEKVKGMANIVLNDALQLRSLRIMNGENGLYVGYPTDPFFRGDEFRALCCPITRDMREAIDDAVLTKYQKIIAPEDSNG